MDSSHFTIIIAIVSAVVSAIIAWLITWYFSNRKRLIISQKTVSIIKSNNDYKRLKVMYDDHAISELKYTSVVIRNKGNKAITKDVLIGKNLTINLGINERIFECNINGVSKNYIMPVVLKKEISSVSLSFELLQKNDEIRLILLHESKDIPNINAEAIETKVLIRDDHLSRIRSYYFLFAFGLFMLSLPIYSASQIPQMIKTDNINGIIIYTCLSIIFSITFIWGSRGYLKDFRVLKKKRKEYKEGIDI